MTTMMTGQRTAEWVGETTFCDEGKGVLYEEGGVYDHKPYCRGMEGARRMRDGELTVACSQCGRGFAESETTADANMVMHIEGDQDIPSICLEQPG